MKKYCEACGNYVDRFHSKSHILPKWMGRSIMKTEGAMKLINMREKTALPVQTNPWGVFWCNDCEVKSGVFDRYASHLLSTNKLNDQIKLKNISNDEYKGNLISGIDFRMFQRFVFACLIRQHLNNKQKGMELIEDNHFKNLLKIYKSDVIDDHSYPILMHFGTSSTINIDPVNLIFQPVRARVDGHDLIKLYTLGAYFEVYISNRKKEDYVMAARLKKDGTIICLNTPITEIGLIRESISHFQKERPNFVKGDFSD